VARKTGEKSWGGDLVRNRENKREEASYQNGRQGSKEKKLLEQRLRMQARPTRTLMIKEEDRYPEKIKYSI